MNPDRGSGAWRCTAVCIPGLEALVANELSALGIRPGRLDPGAVAFEARTRQLYAANLHLRCATRVLVVVAQFGARTFADLERELRRVDWPELSGPVTVRASSRASKLYHTEAIAERVEEVVNEGRAGLADQLLVVRVRRDRVTVSLDASGAPLHHRGWRLAVGKAPLRPTLAAAMLRAAGWDGTTAVVDPFCGSGTIAVEAAQVAAGIPAGAGREFAFQRWPGFQPGTWASLGAWTAGEGVTVVARDRDAGAVAAAEANAARAGVRLDLAVAAVSDLHPPPGPPGLVVTNPPFGRRIGGGDPRNLHARFGDVLRYRFAGWTVAVLVADPALAAQLRLPLDERVRTTTGGLPVRIAVGLASAA